jgi:hypothetical protein
MPLIGATGAFLDRPLPSSNYLLVVSVALNLSGLLLALFALALASVVVAEADEDPASVASLRRWRERVGVAAFTGFGLSVLSFLVFVGNYLNALRP